MKRRRSRVRSSSRGTTGRSGTGTSSSRRRSEGSRDPSSYNHRLGPRDITEVRAMSSRVSVFLRGWIIASLAATALPAKVGSFWTDLPPLPTPRQEVGVAADLDHIYVIGGILTDRSATGIV